MSFFASSFSLFFHKQTIYSVDSLFWIKHISTQFVFYFFHWGIEMSVYLIFTHHMIIFFDSCNQKPLTMSTCHHYAQQHFNVQVRMTWHKNYLFQISLWCTQHYITLIVDYIQEVLCCLCFKKTLMNFVGSACLTYLWRAMYGAMVWAKIITLITTHLTFFMSPKLCIQYFNCCNVCFWDIKKWITKHTLAYYSRFCFIL